MRASVIARRASVNSWSLANGAQVPKIGFGTWKMSKDQALTSVQHALKVGYRHIDSAWNYRNEDATGEAIRKSGVKRNDLFVTSKLWNTFHGDKVEVGLDASLKDLGVDYLDLFLMHWPVAFANPNASQIKALKSSGGHPVEETKLSQDLAATWRKMEEMVQKGKVRNIGISNFNIRRTEELLQASTQTNPTVNQVEVNFGVPNEELLHYSEAHQIMLQAYSPLGGSAYVEKYLNDPIIVDVARRNNITPAQVMLAWPLARGIIPITKSVTPSRIEENFATANLDLPWDDVIHLNKEAQARPIDRSVDPSETWATQEDIFEDYKDQTLLGSLKSENFEVPPAHESDGSHYLEPRNDPNAPKLGPGGTAIREMHTMTPGASCFTPRLTAVQQRMAHRSWTTQTLKSRGYATTAEAAPPTAEELPNVGGSSFLRSDAKSATQTPGIQWADGEKGIERQVRKMNMYTVRDGRRAFSSASYVGNGEVTSSEIPTTPVAVSTRRWKGKPGRVFTPRKAFLFAQYQRLLEASKVVVVYQHNNLSVAEFAKVRGDIAGIPLPEGTEKAARLTVVRSGLMRLLAQKSLAGKRQQSETLFNGPLALLTFDHLSPSYIARVLEVLDKALGAGRLPAKPAPGQSYRQSKAFTGVNTRLVPLATIVEQSADTRALMDIAGLRDIAMLPDLNALRGQIVALLGSTPSTLLATLEQAKGGHVVRTLDAHRQTLASS